MGKIVKTRLGRVLRNKMDKTVVVEVEARRPHPRYKKIVKYRSRFKAHDEGNACGVGDMVRIVETRALSKDKRWRVAEIVTKVELVEVRPEEIE
jgi:small subunit ribosomal protein S17